VPVRADALAARVILAGEGYRRPAGGASAPTGPTRGAGFAAGVPAGGGGRSFRPPRNAGSAGRRSPLALGGVRAFGELLDDLSAERRQVVGLAAGDEAAVGDDLLVDPVGARVAQVGLEAGPRRQPDAVHDAGLGQHPRRVADRPDGLA